MGRKKKSPSEQRASIKWFNEQANVAAGVRDELRRQRQHEEWQKRKNK